MIRSVVYIASAGAIAIVLAYKFRQLRTRWEDLRLWALCAALFFTCLPAWLAAPANDIWVAQVTGIPNLATPLISSSNLVAGALYLALALLWRSPAKEAWLWLRWVFLVTALGITAILVLFSISSVPDERVSDFVIYYSRQPTVAAFVMIWFSLAVIGHGALAYWCFTWARHPDLADLPWLRWSLRLYGALGLDFAVFVLVGIVAVGANWFGVHGVDSVYTATPAVIIPIAAVLLITALLIPVWGPRWLAVWGWVGRWRIFLSLRPLHRALRHIEPAQVLVAPGQRFDPYHRTRRMVLELSDWRWSLAPLFDPAVGDAAERVGREARLAADDLAATIEAAQLKAASHAWRQGLRSSGESSGTQPPHQREEPRDGVLDTELAWWIQVAHAFREFPVVAGPSSRP